MFSNSDSPRQTAHANFTTAGQSFSMSVEGTPNVAVLVSNPNNVSSVSVTVQADDGTSVPLVMHAWPSGVSSASLVQNGVDFVVFTAVVPPVFTLLSVKCEDFEQVGGGLSASISVAARP